MIKASEIPQSVINAAHCDYIVEQIAAVKCDLADREYTRAAQRLEQIKNSVAELSAYIEDATA